MNVALEGGRRALTDKTDKQTHKKLEHLNDRKLDGVLQGVLRLGGKTMQTNHNPLSCDQEDCIKFGGS